MPKSFLIGHDVGTAGSKSVLVDLRGNLMASHWAPYPIVHPHTNRAEQAPEDWWRAVTSSTRCLLQASGIPRRQVIGMGFAGQMLGLVPVDAAGRPTRPAISWMDSRADEQAERMIRRLGGRRAFMWLAGAVPSGKDVVSKLKWIEEEEPEVYRATARFLDVTGYLVQRATGNMVVDHTGAGGTGLLDNKTRTWSALFARLLGIDLAKLPPIRSSIEIAGELTAEAAEAMGLEAGMPVIAGMADIPAAATGSGALEDGDAHIYLGTSSWLCVSVARPRSLGKYGIAAVASPDPEGLIMIGESETAGACLNWFAQNLARPEEWARAQGEMGIFQVLDEVASQVEPGARRLLFAPWMFGERSPVCDTTLRGAFVNLSLEHKREHMLRAVYEGVAYNLRWLVDAAGTAGLACELLRAIGGGASSDLWIQIVADVTQRRVEAVEHPQYAGAVGCALAVAVALGVYANYKQLKQVVQVRQSFAPRDEHRDVYEELYQGFRALYPGVSKVCRRLNRPAKPQT
jgi:xylulokinase